MATNQRDATALPGIQGPKLFGLCQEHPNQRASRTLTLISKAMQQMANLVWDRASHGSQ